MFGQAQKGVPAKLNRMTEEKDIALVVDYLEDRLSTEERAEVTERLQTEPGFKVLHDDLKLLQGGLEGLAHRNLLSRMDRLEEDLDNPLEKKPEGKQIFWTFQRIAAAFIGLALVAFASWYGLSEDGEVNGVALYTEYYSAYENTMMPITRGQGTLTMIERTFEAYETEQYPVADALFTELVAVDKRPFVRFYAGIVAMEVGEVDRAEALFAGVIEEGGDFALQAQWYAALNYLKQEDYENTTTLLEKLEETESSFSQRAKELLKEIR